MREYEDFLGPCVIETVRGALAQRFRDVRVVESSIPSSDRAVVVVELATADFEVRYPELFRFESMRTITVIKAAARFGSEAVQKDFVSTGDGTRWGWVMPSAGNEDRACESVQASKLGAALKLAEAIAAACPTDPASTTSSP
jgi:hypothetical protein